jgi:hypothetical protein
MKYLLALLFAFSLLGSNNPVVGTWDCVAVPDQGDTTSWTLVVKEVDGKLAGTLSGADGVELTLIDPKLDGDRFVFAVMINEQKYTAENKLSGAKFEGTYKGAEATGVLRGTKHP